MKLIRSWEMKKKENAMISNIDSLWKTTCFLAKTLVTILLLCSRNFIKWVLLQRETGVAGKEVLVEVDAEGGKDKIFE